VPYLLDTNVISELRKENCNQHVRAWEAVARRERVDAFLSVLVLGEIRSGVERLQHRDSLQAAHLERWLATVHRDFAGRVLPITAEIAEEWGRLHARQPLPTADGLMAATALIHRLTLVTRNVAHVARTGVSLVNPFEPLPS
jgi:predicted nucleic acid-binding protein